jgi:hypothetical protein
VKKTFLSFVFSLPDHQPLRLHHLVFLQIINNKIHLLLPYLTLALIRFSISSMSDWEDWWRGIMSPYLISLSPYLISPFGRKPLSQNPYSAIKLGLQQKLRSHTHSDSSEDFSMSSPFFYLITLFANC